MAVTVEKIPYGGWSNCYRVANGLVELVVTADIGPRIIRFGFPGGANEFAEFPEDMGRTGDKTWRIYGGHRLWHSPETRARTYFPDNEPVEMEILADGLKTVQPLETNCGIRKRLQVTMAPDAPEVLVEHYLTNEGVWPVEMAVWCLSVMAPGGIGLAPQAKESDEEGLLPNRTLTLWPYTNMADSRYTWGDGLVRLRQDPDRGPTKFGLSVTAGWGAYANRGHLFLKQFAYEEGADYPDGGCSLEAYTNQRFFELESLSPLTPVAPGETVSHAERWTLAEDFILPDADEAAMEKVEKHLR